MDSTTNFLRGRDNRKCASHLLELMEENRETAAEDLIKSFQYTINDLDSNGTSLLNEVICNISPHAPSLIETMLKNGADPNTQDKWGWTALMTAVSQRHTDIIDIIDLLLKEPGIDINALNKEGRTTLHILADWPFLETAHALSRITENLIDKGANINALDKTHCSPLHAAILAANTGVIDTLLQQDKIDVNTSRSWGGETMLHSLLKTDFFLYSMEGNFVRDEKRAITIMEKLLDKGADINALSTEGRTPLDVLLESTNFIPAGDEFKSKVEVLIKSGAKISSQLDESSAVLDFVTPVDPYANTTIDPVKPAGDLPKVDTGIESL